MDLTSFYNQFRDETQENIRVLSEVLVQIEQLPEGDPERKAGIDRIFRAVHTVKGSARMLGFEQVGRLAHVMETLLGSVRQGERTLTPALASQLLQAGDGLLELSNAAVENRSPTVEADQLIAAISTDDAPRRSPSTEPTAAPLRLSAAEANEAAGRLPPAAPLDGAGRPSAPGRQQTVRVRIDRLDKLINLAGELVVGQQFLAHHTDRFEELATLIEQQERTIRSLSAELGRLRFQQAQRRTLDSYLQRLNQDGEQLRRLAEHEQERLARYINQQGIMVGDLEREVLAARMVPIGTLFASIPRAVRDLAQTTQKQVGLELLGETVELDRKVLELLGDPILHLVRNAIDHGIERPEERVANGKGEAGKLTIVAEAVGGEVRVSISDDGRGMDPQQLRDAAVRKGMLSAERARLLSEQESYELIFMPGFSTATMITDISGRGVGMDVVRSNITDLGGHVTITSQPRQGTTITLSLPLTLITTRIVLVRLGRSQFALPASGCRGTIWVYQETIHTVEARETIAYGGRTIPVVHLADLLGVESSGVYKRGVRAPAVLIRNGNGLLAALVDDLIDEREAVVKPLGRLLERWPIYSGAVQLGDGQLVLLLNTMLLSKRAVGGRSSRMPNPAVAPTVRGKILVSDDSFTTRELIKSILASVGYEVTSAVDGQDALDKLRAGTYDLVVSDVEMPRVDGFQLTSRIRRELGYQDLPVILVTSLASEAHRRQGLEAGAQAYIVKSQFNQESLLEVIQQLLGHEE